MAMASPLQRATRLGWTSLHAEKDSATARRRDRRRTHETGTIDSFVHFVTGYAMLSVARPCARTTGSHSLWSCHSICQRTISKRQQRVQ